MSITSVSVSKPTLDEVFLAVTGHDAGPAGNDQDAAGPEPSGASGKTALEVK